MEEVLGGALAFAGGVAGWFFGSFDGVVRVLVALSVIDYVSGVGRAVVRREVSSEVGFHGILRKIAIFLLVGVAHVIDTELLGGIAMLRDAVCFFYLGNEGLSIAENFIGMGLPVPDWVREKFAEFTEHKLKGK